MATSGSVDISTTRNEIVLDALSLCRAVDPDEAVPAGQLKQGIRFLNRMVKIFQAQGLHLWTESEAVLFMTRGQRIYTFPDANAADPETVGEMVIDLPAFAGGFQIDVLDGLATATGDVIGILLDTDVVQWTTVTAVAGQSIQITDALAANVSAGQVVFSFPAKINRPLKILSARRTIKGIDSPLEIVSRQEYVDLPNKETTGLVNEIYYKPLNYSGELYLWPTGDTILDRLSFTYQRPIEVFDAADNNPDFPVEHHEMLVANLAFRLAPNYGVPPDTYQIIREQARMTYEMVSSFDAETVSVFIGVR